MKNVFFVLVLFFISVCGSTKRNNNPVVDPQRSQLIEIKEKIKEWSLVCGETIAKKGGGGEFDPVGCETGDAALFNGLLCASGDAFSCLAIKLSQGEDGKMWRSPYYVESNTINSFSRDMALGVLLYLVVTKDKDLAEKWISYIKSNNNRLCEEATDDRCNITTGLWGLFGRVWRHIDLPRTSQMVDNMGTDETILNLSVSISPKGYQLHLHAVDLFIRLLLKRENTLNQDSIKTIFDRQPDNPFFSFLQTGNSERTIRLVTEQCITEENDGKFQWSWERDTDEKAWLNSMGHDCIFIINLLLRNN